MTSKLRADKKQRSLWTSPLGRSLLLHVVIILGFVINLSLPAAMPGEKSQVEPKIVNAVTIDQQAVDDNLKQIQANEEAKQQAERQRVERIRKLKAAAIKAKEAKEAEERRLKDILAKRKLEEERQKAEQQAQAENLARIRAEKEKAETELKQLQQRQLQAKQQAIKEQQQAKQQAMEEQQARQQAINDRFLSVANKYKAMILRSIGQHWLIPADADKQLSCQLLIRLAPGGTVVDVQLVKSSGNTLLDRSAIAAVYKASPLPIPNDPELFDKFRELSLTVRPEGLLGNYAA